MFSVFPIVVMKHFNVYLFNPVTEISKSKVNLFGFLLLILLQSI